MVNYGMKSEKFSKYFHRLYFPSWNRNYLPCGSVPRMNDDGFASSM